MPVWAAIGAENLANFEAVPESVMRLVIFGDNDRNFVGQEAAYRLAKRWAGRLPAVEVAHAFLRKVWRFIRFWGKFRWKFADLSSAFPRVSLL